MLTKWLGTDQLWMHCKEFEATQKHNLRKRDDDKEYIIKPEGC